MDDHKVAQIRSRRLAKLREAVRPDHGEVVTREEQEGTLQALCAVAAAVFLARRAIPPDLGGAGWSGGLVERLVVGAMEGMEAALAIKGQEGQTGEML